MASLGDIYQLKMVSTHVLGQTSELNFYYKVTTAGSGGALQVRSRFQTVFETDMSVLMCHDWTITEYQTINGMNNSDFEEFTVSVAGTDLSDCLPPAMTFLVRSPRAVPGDIPAMRRFPWGSSVNLTASEGEWDAAFLVIVESVVDDLSSDLVLATGEDLGPIQLTGGFKLGVTPVELRSLAPEWQYAQQPGWLRSREPDLDWLQSV